MNKFTKRTLGDLCHFQAGNAFPPSAQGCVAGKYPFIKVSDLNLSGNEIFIFKSNNWVENKENYNIHKNGSIVFAKIGIALTYNRRRILTRDTIIDNNMMSATASHDVNGRFLYYLLCTIDFNDISSGSALPYLTVRDLNALTVFVPPQNEQYAIASILSSLDDKIELNRRTNETLEAMARALFRDWFVDFGPTRAKMAGEAPYLAPELWELFPDRLDDEGKPEGWHYQTLDTLCERTIGGLWGEEEDTPKSPSQFICLRGVDLQHLKETGMCPSAPKRWGNINAIQKRIIQPNEFLIASSGAGPCGRSLWLGKFTHNIDVDIPVIFSNFVKKFTTPEEAVACYIEFIISNMHRSGEIQSFINGTSVPNLDDDALLKTYTILDPGIKIIRKFFEFIVSVLNMKMSKESYTLAQLRDLLLPKLMSGEISIRDAEKMVEDAA